MTGEHKNNKQGPSGDFFGRTGARGGELEVWEYCLFKKWGAAKRADEEGQMENSEDIAQ